MAGLTGGCKGGGPRTWASTRGASCRARTSLITRHFIYPIRAQSDQCKYVENWCRRDVNLLSTINFLTFNSGSSSHIFFGSRIQLHCVNNFINWPSGSKPRLGVLNPPPSIYCVFNKALCSFTCFLVYSCQEGTSTRVRLVTCKVKPYFHSIKFSAT